MRVALKIDVFGSFGTTAGVAPLLELLATYQVKASFFVLPKTREKAGGLVKKAASIFSKPSKQLLSVEEAMLAIVEADHELGLLGGGEYAWRKRAAFADADWTNHQLALAREAFENVMGYPPSCFAAPCWQVNAHLLSIEERMEFLFASDVRGKYPFLPVLHNVQGHCPQIPTTLPTLSEVLFRGDVTPENAHEYLYAESRHLLPHGHVFTIDAEHDGVRHLDVLEKLLVMWKGQEGFIRALGDVHADLDKKKLPVHQIGWGELPGRRFHLAMQSVQIRS